MIFSSEKYDAARDDYRGEINTCKQRKWNRVIFHGEKYILMLHLNSGQLDLIIAKVATNC